MKVGFWEEGQWRRAEEEKYEWTWDVGSKERGVGGRGGRREEGGRVKVGLGNGI